MSALFEFRESEAPHAFGPSEDRIHIPPPVQPDAQQTKEARKLEGLYAGATSGDIKAVNALQEELQSLRNVQNPNAYLKALNTQFNLDQNGRSQFPDVRIDYENGTMEMWSNSDGSKAFSEDSNGAIESQGNKAYPPNPQSMPLEYSNGTQRIENSILGPQSQFVQNLEFLASGAQDGNPLDASKLQAELKTLNGSSPNALDQLNASLGATAKVDGVFDLPTFELVKEGNDLQMNVWYPYDGRQFSESSSGKTSTTTQVPLDTSPDQSPMNGPDVRFEMPEVPYLDKPRVPKY